MLNDNSNQNEQLPNVPAQPLIPPPSDSSYLEREVDMQEEDQAEADAWGEQDEEDQQIQEKEDPGDGDDYGAYGGEDDDEGWGDYGDDDDEYQIKDVDVPKLGTKKSSYNMDKRPYKIVKLTEVEKMIPAIINQVQELLENSEDEAITLLRHFNWSFQKLEEQWFTMGDNKMKEIGLEYDE